MSRFLTDRINKLTPYVPGEQPKERKYIKLNTNESPFPPSKKAVDYSCEAAKRLMLYPDPEARELTIKMAQELGVEAENVIMTNGSDEVLNFAFMCYCDNDTPAIFPDITYGFYKVFAEVNGVPYIEIPLREDFTINLSDYEGKRGLVVIANPNAPTGINIDLCLLEDFIASDKNRMVVIDEAYVDFGGESAVKLVKKYDNLLVTGTFSKSRSMAGGRLGFGVGCEEIIRDLARVKYSTNPYNVNSMTAAAGLGCLSDKEYFEKNCKTVIENREYTAKRLSAMGFELTDSKANFLFASSDKISGESLYLRLKENGILVRYFGAERIKNYVRITVGSKEQMDNLLSCIEKILEEI